MQLKLIALAALAAATPSFAATLWSNGSLITDPTGGTGNIAGQALSKAEPYPFGSLTATTTGVGAGNGTAQSQPTQFFAADDFYVPNGNWDIDQIRVYGFQTYSSTATTFGQTVTKVKLNIWDTIPYTAQSPDLPPGTPIPQPLLSVPMVFDVTNQGSFVAHRVSGSSTNTVRPIYSWTVSGDFLPNNGQLAAGHYWLQFGFEGVGPQTNNVFVPLVTPRAQTTDHNGRLFNVPFSGSPASWFEGREGFVSAAEPGRAYSLPFELIGTPEPTSLSALAGAAMVLRRRRAK